MEKEALKTLVEQLLLKGMGVCLDMGRMSIQSDRGFKQYERSIRQEFRSLINNGQKLIDDSSNPSV